MFVKLKDDYINLDLVKGISEVTAYKVTEDSFKAFGSKSKNIREVLPNQEAYWLNAIVNGNEYEKEHIIVYGFKVRYLDKSSDLVTVGALRNEAEKAREALATLLNGNQPVIHVIKY